MLLSELMSSAERAGVRKLIAVIGDSANLASIGAHRACGFSHAGVLSACGWKFERWLDVVLMQCTLGTGDRQPPN
jgi:phosphinothricin acetyltransferase